MRRALVTLALLAAATTARADDELGEARRLQGALEYEQALALVERAIAHGGADHDRVVELHVLAGTLAAGLDRASAAEDHFARALALAPAATLPDGTSPKITAPFDAARARTPPLRISTRVVAGEIVVDVADDPLHLVAKTQHAGQRVVALDTYGNELWTTTIVVPPPPPPPPPRRPAARWPVFAIATGVALGAGALCAWRFQVAQDEWNTLRAEDGQHDYSQLVAAENRARAWAIGANVAFGVAAAGAIATTIVLVVDRRRRAALSVSPTAFAISARF